MFILGIDSILNYIVSFRLACPFMSFLSLFVFVNVITGIMYTATRRQQLLSSYCNLQLLPFGFARQHTLIQYTKFSHQMHIPLTWLSV